MADGDELPPIDFLSIGRDTKCAGFKCADREITQWFGRKALKEHLSRSIRVTCAVAEKVPHRPLGFYALATVAEEVNSLPGAYHPFRSAEYFSALQLVWLATDHSFERRGLGSLMVGQAIRVFAEIGPVIGLPHLIVIPAKRNHERLTKFYRGLGFTPYKDGEAMFLSLQAAEEALDRAIEASSGEGA